MQNQSNPMIPARYTKTVEVSCLTDFDTMKPGQWFQWVNGGGRGQWLGKTRAGVDAVRHGKFGKQNAQRNKLVRQWAKSNGAK